MEKQLRNKTLTGFFIVGLLLIALLVFSNPILSSPIRQAEATGELIYTFDSVKSTYLKFDSWKMWKSQKDA